MSANLTTLRDFGSQPKRSDLAMVLEEKHISPLPGLKEYRESLDVASLWKRVDWLNFVDDPVEVEVAQCESCGKTRTRELGASTNRPCEKHWSYCRDSRDVVAQCWMSRGEADQFIC